MTILPPAPAFTYEITSHTAPSCIESRRTHGTPGESRSLLQHASSTLWCLSVISNDIVFQHNPIAFSVCDLLASATTNKTSTYFFKSCQFKQVSLLCQLSQNVMSKIHKLTYNLCLWIWKPLNNNIKPWKGIIYIYTQYTVPCMHVPKR